jgi:hypothetical protein
MSVNNHLVGEGGVPTGNEQVVISILFDLLNRLFLSTSLLCGQPCDIDTSVGFDGYKIYQHRQLKHEQFDQPQTLNIGHSEQGEIKYAFPVAVLIPFPLVLDSAHRCEYVNYV